MPNDDDQRHHFRVRYPAGARPAFKLAENQLSVSELSEGGMRVVGMSTDIAEDTSVRGTIELCAGGRCEVSAVVGRVDGAERILIQLEGVSFAAVMREQQHLVRRFPDYRDKLR